MNKADEELLMRVQKYAPDILEQSGVPDDAFDELTKALIDAPPHPKQKRLKGKRLVGQGHARKSQPR